ncbi:pre-mRNA-processing factor 17-like [Ornithodoros turicata]|uniref:Pre-mRNA-processing factor 17 n=1 Tax=Ornithodoros turicata TaxID=34597 RepID=A0A2R5LNA7_9ACAR
MASLSTLCDYGSSSDEDESVGRKATDTESQVAVLPKEATFNTLRQKYGLNAAPEVAIKESVSSVIPVDPNSKMLEYNPKYESLYAPALGPENPFKTQQQKAVKNTLCGYVEPAHVNDFHFESQRLTFTSFGYALDPTADGSHDEGKRMVGAPEATDATSALTVFEKTKTRPGDKRKKAKNNNPEDVDGFLGPWAPFADQKLSAKPTEEEQEELDEILAKRNKRGKHADHQPMEEKTVLHIKDPYDYQGRSFLHIPQDVGVNLRSSEPPEKCFIPKREIHTWKGHSKGVYALRWFPKSGHLLLSCSMDCKVKLWEVYNERRCVRTYVGHRQAVRDISFNNQGTKFLSAGYDRYIKLWDTETGECISRFSNRKVAYCVKFNPDNNKQDLFVAGTSDKKIVCWDTRTKEIVQEYDRHLGAVNTITFVDDNRRFVSTSDDKSMRVWEWDIPVDMKYIADPTMHSMPAVTLSPNGKWLACQSLDSKIMIFSALNRFKLNRKKTFGGHMVDAYACGLDFSPDMSYLISGDADGWLCVWDWKTTKLYTKLKAHSNVCISVLWHPHETSKVATAGFDGLIKYWD